MTPRVLARFVGGEFRKRHVVRHAGRLDTTVIPASRDAAWEYFGFNRDADAIAKIDLGSRILGCLATPGHEAAVTFYDPWTGFLLTGDTVHPGRLYIQDWQAFAHSIDRLIEFSDHHPVTHVIGCHIEMTRQPGVDYPIRTTYQPDEPPPELTTDHLRQVRTALKEIGDHPTRRAFPDFILYPTP